MKFQYDTNKSRQVDICPRSMAMASITTCGRRWVHLWLNLNEVWWGSPYSEFISIFWSAFPSVGRETCDLNLPNSISFELVKGVWVLSDFTWGLRVIGASILTGWILLHRDSLRGLRFQSGEGPFDVRGPGVDWIHRWWPGPWSNALTSWNPYSAVSWANLIRFSTFIYTILPSSMDDQLRPRFQGRCWAEHTKQLARCSFL